MDVLEHVLNKTFSLKGGKVFLYELLGMER